MKERGICLDRCEVLSILAGSIGLPDRWRRFLGAAGDRFWVRETFAFIWPHGSDDGFVYDDDNWEYGRPIRDDECTIEYRADTGNPRPGEWPAEDAEGPRWRSPATMPRWASRIILEIVHVRRGGIVEFKRIER